MHKFRALCLLSGAFSLLASLSVAAPGPRAGAHVSGNNYQVTMSAGGCKAGEECTATIRLEATGTYHINDTYPYKFTANDSAGVEFLGKDGAGKNVFSKGAGDFAKQSEKVGVLTVRFRPANKGNANVAGKFKMSVCSEQNCQLESPELSLSVKVN